MPLNDLLTDAHPFGPIDQTLIDDLKDAVDILGLFGPLSLALAGNHNLIYGRKGCGKSAVISMLEGFERARGRFSREKIKLADVFHNSIFLSIKTWTEFFNMNTNVRRNILDRTNAKSAADIDYDLIPAEVVETAWINELWDRIFQKLYDLIQEGSGLINVADIEQLSSVILCFDDDGMSSLRGTPEYIASKVFQSAKSEVVDFLHRKNISVCMLFDSMERYPMSNSTFALSASGFLRAINKMTTQHNRIKIVFSLPEELLPRFHASSSNILKDFARSYAMKWEPVDLLRIAAYRYTLFLGIHDRPYYDLQRLESFEFHDRKALNEFFGILMPSTITNDIGVTESTKAYILRHTFLVPRHLLLILNRIALYSFEESKSWRQFTESGIVKGIRSCEEEIAREIFVPYEPIYREIQQLLNKSLGHLPPIFTYGDLDRSVTRIKGLLGMEDYELIRLLYEMGIIGRLLKMDQATIDPKYAMYTMANFFYNSPGNISFSGSDVLCFHPAFSTFFNASRNRNGDARVIYPHGLRAEIIDNA